MTDWVGRWVGAVCIFGWVLGLGCWMSSVAVAVSDGRIYEMVSPVYKGGYGVGDVGGLIGAVAPNGESVAFASKGTFAGAPAGPSGNIDYMAGRGVSNWSTVAVMPPTTVLSQVDGQDASPTLGSIVALGKPGRTFDQAFQEGTEVQFWLHNVGTADTIGGWEQVGSTMKALDGKPFGVSYEGASTDFCKLFVEPNEAMLPEALESKGFIFQPYELDRGCGGESKSLRLVGLNNNKRVIVPSCKAVVGTESGKASRFNAISADGGEVFFTSGVSEANGLGCDEGRQLFVRLDGERTVEVSKPIADAGGCGGLIPCPGASVRASAEFAGASEDGSVVFFTTAAPLVGEDGDVKTDLYMARIGCSSSDVCGVDGREVTSLVRVSHDLSAGKAAEVEGVVRVSPDGSRVYFVARGVLSEGVGADGRVPVRGAENFYVYDGTSGRTSFIADLCSGAGFSGVVEDLRCLGGNDQGLWAENVVEAQTAGLDGRFLVFSSDGQLTGDDTDTSTDVYRYDAESGVLSRVSLGEEGYDADGNNNGFDATITPGHEGGEIVQQHEMNNRAISEDGLRIVFSTSESLSPHAVNGLTNVYEWHLVSEDGEGLVSLVSSGSAEEPVIDPVMSQGGGDVFFATTQGLVSQDGDGATDIYDARLHGGFVEPPGPRQACAGDACQGPLTNPAPLLVPGSVSQAAGQNLPLVKSAPRKPKSKRRAPVRRKRHNKKGGKGGARGASRLGSWSSSVIRERERVGL
jgi:hypothetical protein